MLIRTPWKRAYSCLWMWMTSNWLERNKILIRWGKYWTKKLIWENLDHVYLVCSQRQCEISKDIVDNYRTMFESIISVGATEKLPFPQNLRISSWSYDMEGHAKKCVEQYCELANKNDSTLQSILHALTTIISKKKNWNPWENCQKYALKLFGNAYTWHVLNDLIFYGQWTNLHDRSQNGPKLVTNDYLVWSPTSITHVITNNSVM